MPRIDRSELFDTPRAMMKHAERRGGRLPPWLRKPGAMSGATHAMKQRLRAGGLATVCEGARCPNRGECFAAGTATFLLMGPHCTRNCRFCAISHELPAPLDPDDPRRVAEAVAEMGLSHAVVTSVTRDDLPDGGAGHFAACVAAIRERMPKTTIELLVPDFGGSSSALEDICAAAPEVLNHNIETVRRLTPVVRSRATYECSIELLRRARSLQEGRLVKSGLMIGVGEELAEVEETLANLAGAGCDIVTIGQYLQPERNCLPVERYWEPHVFVELQEKGLKYGLRAVLSGPYVRSSYHAREVLKCGGEGGEHG